MPFELARTLLHQLDGVERRGHFLTTERRGGFIARLERFFLFRFVFRCESFHEDDNSPFSAAAGDSADGRSGRSERAVDRPGRRRERKRGVRGATGLRFAGGEDRDVDGRGGDEAQGELRSASELDG